MAEDNWLKVDAALEGSMKFKKLVLTSGLSRFECLGGLVAFWSWAKIHKENGDLSLISDEDIDLTVGLEGFGKCLKGVGFLDKDGWIADWSSWGGSALKNKISRNRLAYAEKHKAFIDHYSLFQEIPTKPKKDQDKPKKSTEGEKKKSKKRTEDKDPPLTTTLGADAANPFGDMMKIFSDFKVVTTQRPGKFIGMINTVGEKLGQDTFLKVVTAYCKDEYCRKAGLSMNGFLKNVDKFATRITAGVKLPEQAQGAAGKGYTGPVTTEEEIDPAELAAAQADIERRSK